MQSIVSFADVNVETGTAATTLISANDARFRNVANDLSGEIDLRQARRGINFPGRYNGGGFSYYSGPNMTIEAVADNLTTGTAAANSFFAIYPNGVLQHITTETRGTVTTNLIRTNRTWLTAGVASDYTINFTLSSGAFSSGSNVTATDLSLSSTRVWMVRAFAGFFPNFTINTAAGTFIVKQAGTEIFRRPFNFYAEARGGDSCRVCCFTPETLITMADRSYKRIDEIQIGDHILSYNHDIRSFESKQVTEIITRINRVMYEYLFDDDSTLNASEDHPLYVIDKGYSSVNPTIEYKDLGMPKVISVGDKVLTEDGKHVKILQINEIYYPETVYTFKESCFYANKYLVY